MRQVLAAATIVLVSAGASWAQTVGGACGDVVNDPNATCPSVMAPSAGGSINSGGSGGSVTTPGSAIDRGTTNSVTGSSGATTVPGSAGTIPSVQQSKGMAPLDIPSDPLNGSNRAPAGSGTATGNNNPSVPFSNQGVTTGGSSISSPSIN